jgi:hypothetical protein
LSAATSEGWSSPRHFDYVQNVLKTIIKMLIRILIRYLKLNKTKPITGSPDHFAAVKTVDTYVPYKNTEFVGQKKHFL